MNKLVSIVVPVYNMGDKIEICVESLLKQTYRNIEINLVDDGSVDDSLEHCNRMMEKDSRVRVFHTENRGSGPARNHGIENSRGEYIFFPDADDYCEPDAIEVLLKAALENDCDLVISGYKSLDENGKIVTEKKFAFTEVSGEQLRSNYAYYKVTAPEFGFKGAPWNKLFKMSIIKEHGIEYPPLRRHQDEGFIARYMGHTKRACFIGNVLYIHYVNSQELEWKKYPVDYIDAVKGLYEDRRKNVLTWNTQDNATKQLVLSEYLTNVIKAFELSFSPKFNFSPKQRIDWLKEKSEQNQLFGIEAPICLGKYHKAVLKLIKKKHFNLLYLALKFKIGLEKNSTLKKVAIVLNR